MITVFGTNTLNQRAKGAAVTIGNFDGVHLGHQSLLRRVLDKAKALDLQSLVLTFDPHPSKVLAPDRSVPRLYSLSDLQSEMAKLVVDFLVIENFTHDFSGLSAQDFVEEILVNRINAKYICVGHDFVFGYQREGTFHFLQKMAQLNKFQVEKHEPILLNGEIVSSTAIRKLITSGQVEKASQFLGRYYSIFGTAVAGEGRGKRLGYPTINLATSAEVLPAQGVYITQVELKGELYPALTNVGTKPTFHHSYHLVVESYLLTSSLAAEVSGEVRVFFCQRLRDEIKFPSAESLIQQIDRDVQRAKQYFKIK